jgi:hypothetical protein
VFGGLDKPSQVGMQQIRIIGKQIIDQPASLRMPGQGAQQIWGYALPSAQSAAPHERSHHRLFIICPQGDISPGAQQGVVECLMEQPVLRHGIPAMEVGRGAAPGFYEEVGRRGSGKPGQVFDADTGPVDGFHRKLPQRDGQPWCFGEGKSGEHLCCRELGDRAEPVQIGGQRRIHSGSELELVRGGGCVMLQAVGPGDQAGDEEVLPGHGGDARGQRPGERLAGVGVAGAFIPGQLQACQRVGGQVLFGEVAGLVQVDWVQGAAEAAQQITAVVAAPGADNHLGADIGACLGQRQHNLVDNGACLSGAVRFVKRVDDHVEHPPALAERVADGGG